MKKIISSFFLSMIVFISCALPVLADTDGFWSEYARFDDSAFLTTVDEENAISDKLDEISERQHFDIVIVTVDDIAGYDSVMDFADDYYDYLDFGYGDDRDGIILLISMEERDYWISASGFGMTAFTADGLEYIKKQIAPSLSDGDYGVAFNKFADLCDDFITKARTDKPYDSSNLPHAPLSSAWIFISIGTGLIIALIIVNGMKSKLRTVRAQDAANNYVRDGSMNVTSSRDLFLYRKIDRSAKSSSSGSSDNKHTSSSGASHTGSGGKF